MRHRIVAALALLLLTACGAPQEPLVSGRITDRDPVDFGTPAPQRMPVQGIDVSRFQRDVNWTAAHHAGIRFAFIKVSEGGDLVDPMLRNHWADSGRAGIIRGGYHFYYFCTTPQTQARWFLRHYPSHTAGMPPVLDMEWNPLSPTCRRRPDGATTRAEMRVWLNAVERATGQRPIIYTTPGFYEDNDLQRLSGYEFWLRSTAKPLREAYPRSQRWRFWQYSATGRLPGTQGDIDLNAFNGSAEAFEAWRKR